MTLSCVTIWGQAYCSSHKTLHYTIQCNLMPSRCMGNVEIKLHTSITSAPDGCCCPASHSLHLYSWAEKCFGQDGNKNSDMHASTRRGYPIHQQSHGPLMQNLKYEMITVIPCFVLVFLTAPLLPQINLCRN